MKQLLADLADLKGFLTAIALAWGIVAANLSQIGVPVKVVSIGAAGVALLAFLIGDAISSFGGSPAAAAPKSTSLPEPPPVGTGGAAGSS